MKILWSLATGGRPKTAAISLAATAFLASQMNDIQVDVVRWKDDTEVPESLNVIEMPYTTKPEALNASLAAYEDRHGLPDFWVTTDDDIVLSSDTLTNIIQVMDEDRSIWLGSGWNDGCERNPPRGVLRSVGQHVVQYDNGGEPFCVGGALHVIRRELLETLGPYSTDHPRTEDDEFTRRVRGSGHKAVIVRTAVVAIMPDDGVWEEYRPRLLKMHWEGWRDSRGVIG